jgi:hypothetical protein
VEPGAAFLAAPRPSGAESPVGWALVIRDWESGISISCFVFASDSMT